MQKSEQDLYDEFGNYIGPASEEEKDDQSFDLDENQSENDYEEARNLRATDEYETRVIERAPLHEEKQYYPELALAYPNAETMVQEEDIQELEEPIIQAPKPNNFYTRYNFEDDPSIKEFMLNLQKNNKDVRNIAMTGAYHSGKTKLCDLLINSQTLTTFTSPNKKFTTDSVFERERKLTINVKPFSFPFKDKNGKHYLFNVLDTPGHPDFFDEVKCAFELVDGVILIIDVIEGVTQHCKRIIEEIKHYDLNYIVVINKIDRLVLEAKVPPEDAYLKIKLVLDELNDYADASPTKNNVLFASTKYKMLFGLDFFAKKSLSQIIKSGVPVNKLLWGNVYWDYNRKEFTKDAKGKSLRRTFVEFVLDPIYKIFSHIVAKEKEPLRSFLQKLGLEVKNKTIEEISLKELLQNVLVNYLCDVPELVHMVTQNIIDNKQGNDKILKRLLRGNHSFTQNDDDILILITKIYPEMPALDDPPKNFSIFGRVISGLPKANTKLSMCDAQSNNVNQIPRYKFYFPHCAHLKFQVSEAYSGSLIYIEGAGSFIEKQGWIYNTNKPQPKLRMRELGIGSKVKMALDPLRPSQLPIVMENLSYLNKVFPGLKLKTEESGEVLIFGRGELFMDTVLNFLRNFYAKCEIRLSEPSCALAEAGIVTSQMFGRARSENKKNALEFITEPLEKGIINNYLFLKNLELDEIEMKTLSSVDDTMQNSQAHNISQMILDENDTTTLRGCLVNTFKWDKLAAKTLWCFGSSQEHPCLLSDDSFQSKSNKNLLLNVKSNIINGFNWAIREGPLCEEPLREMKVKLTNFVIAEDVRFRSNEQLTAMSRKAIHTAMLLSTPRLLEPYYDVEIMCTQDALQTMYTILARRRGQLVYEKPKPGTIFYEVVSRIPILESFGFETDIRTQTLGQATVSMSFSGWELMPGDPLDKDVKLGILEPVEPNSLARDVMIKTRRRKGLSDDISIVKYFDDENILNAIKNSFFV